MLASGERIYLSGAGIHRFIQADLSTKCGNAVPMASVAVRLRERGCSSEFEQDRVSPVGGDEQDEVDNRDVLQHLILSFRETGDLSCSCNEPDFEITESTVEAETARISCRCKRCRAESSECKSLEELRRIGGV